MKARLSRRDLLRALGLGSAGVALAACAPKVVKETVVVEKVVKETVVVTEEKVVKEAVEVEKEVTRVVEKVVEKEAAPKPQVEIRVHTNQGDQWYGWWNEAWETNVAGWRSEHPNIIPKFEPVAGWLNEFYPVIFAHVAAGTLGDIVWTRGTHRSNLSWALEYDICRDLMPIVEATNHDLGQYYPGVIQQSSWEGKFFYMPLTSEPTCPVIAYNRDLVERMGVPEPQNDWDYMQVTEWGQSLTTDEVFGFDVGNMSGATVSTTPQYRQFGAKMTSDDGKTVLPEAKDVEAVEKVLQWRHDLIYKYKTHPVASPEFDVSAMFIAEKLASFIVWPVNIGRLPVTVGEKFRVGFFYAPLDQQGAKRRSRLHEHVHGVTTASKNPTEAFEFLAFHSSLEFAVQGMLVGKGSTVGRPDFFEDPRTLKILPNIAIITPIMAEIEPDFFCANYRGAEFEREWKAKYDLVMLDKLSPTEGAEQIKEVCQGVLNQPIA
ncbi:MAG: extracellular solute-binding protein [Anaerolineae bacterium]|nr:extracellular solute-binding protein [Anaerolineae bacterium]